MSAIDFPANPTTGQEFTAAGLTWVWDGAVWRLAGSGGGGGGVIIGDPANPPADMAVGQQIFGPGGPTTVLASWLFRPSGNLLAGQARPNISTFTNWVAFQFAAIGADAQPTFEGLRDIARPGDIITMRLVDDPTQFRSARVLYMGGGWQFGFTVPPRRGTWVWVDPNTATGTMTAWPAAVDTPVTFEVTPNPDLSDMWLMTPTGLVRARSLPPQPKETPTMVAAVNGGTALAKGANSIGNTPLFGITTGFQSSDADVFAAIDTSRLRILQPGRYRITIAAQFEFPTGGATPDPGPSPQRSGFLTVAVWRVPADNALNVGQVSVTQAQIPWGPLRPVPAAVTNIGFLEVTTVQQDLFVRISENGNWPAGDIWRMLPATVRVERLAFDS